jgi:hypothetical protein
VEDPDAHGAVVEAEPLHGPTLHSRSCRS